MTARRPARRSPALFFVLCSLLTFVGCGPKAGTGTNPDASAPLKVGIIPFEDAAAISKGFAPFATYLGKKAGRPGGQVFVTPAYAGVLQALQSDQIDVAYLNPLCFRQFQSFLGNVPGFTGNNGPTVLA